MCFVFRYGLLLGCRKKILANQRRLFYPSWVSANSSLLIALTFMSNNLYFLFVDNFILQFKLATWSNDASNLGILLKFQLLQPGQA